MPYSQSESDQFVPLYKYFKISDRLLTSLKAGSLWFSHANDFNDPYDCYGKLMSYVLDSHQKAKEAIKFVINTSSPPTMTRQERRSHIKELAKRPREIVNAYTQTRQEVIDTEAVCCFSCDPLSTLMWSHYADGHKGLCLEFNHTQLKYSFDILKVNYTDEFKPLNYFDEQHKAIVNVFTTKSTDWRYEKEYRAIKERSGHGTFHKASLIGITFGCNTSDKSIKSVMDAVCAAGYNVKFSQAKMLEKSFKLYIDPM